MNDELSSGNRARELQERLAAVIQRIEAAAAASGRDSGDITLLPVTKFHPVDDIRILEKLGVTAVGENREQEARAKAAELPSMDFHMIGQIQTKKANAVARWAACVHSVDSVRLTEALDRGVALAIDREERSSGPLPCLIQLSLDGDTSRGGVERDGIDDVAAAIEHAHNLSFQGVMCVPPLGWDAGESFGLARAVVDKLAGRFGRALELSAGMSGDLEHAVARGSTILRVGTEILGPRPVA